GCLGLAGSRRASGEIPSPRRPSGAQVGARDVGAFGRGARLAVDVGGRVAGLPEGDVGELVFVRGGEAEVGSPAGEPAHTCGLVDAVVVGSRGRRVAAPYE